MGRPMSDLGRQRLRAIADFLAAGPAESGVIRAHLEGLGLVRGQHRRCWVYQALRGMERAGLVRGDRAEDQGIAGRPVVVWELP